MENRSNIAILNKIFVALLISLLVVVFSWFLFAILQDILREKTNVDEISISMLISIVAALLATVIFAPIVSIPAILAHYYIVKKRIAQKKFRIKMWVFDGSVIGGIYGVILSFFIDYDLRSSLWLITLLLSAGALTGYFTWRFLMPLEIRES